MIFIAVVMNKYVQCMKSTHYLQISDDADTVIHYFGFFLSMFFGEFQ
jgi:hypothetical protein